MVRIREFLSDINDYEVFLIFVVVSLICIAPYDIQWASIFACSNSKTTLCDYQGVLTAVFTGLAGLIVWFVYKDQQRDVSNKIRHGIVAAIIQFNDLLKQSIVSLEKEKEDLRYVFKSVKEILVIYNFETPPQIVNNDSIVKLDIPYIHQVSLARIQIESFLNAVRIEIDQHLPPEAHREWFDSQLIKFFIDGRDLCSHLDNTIRCLILPSEEKMFSSIYGEESFGKL